MSIVDILIATRNDNDQALRKTLNSIQRSSFLNMRVLLVNDSDHPINKNALSSGNIPIKIVENLTCKGLTASLIMAVNESNADYYARADIGDELSSNRIEEQVLFMEKNSECVVVGCATQLFVMFKSMPESIGVTFSSLISDDIKQLLLKGNPFVHGSILMRADAYNEVGGYDQKVLIAQDINLYLKMSKLGDFAILNNVLHKHTFYINTSTTFLKNKTSIYSALKSRVKYLTLNKKTSISFIIGITRDILLLSLPMRLLIWIRIFFIKRRRYESAKQS